MCSYVVLDLEMCKVPRKNRYEFPHSMETIEIGAVLMNDTYEIIGEFQTYIRPEFGILDSDISKLTHITESNLQNAPNIEQALHTFSEWLPEDSVFVSWSENDQLQLSKEIMLKKLSFPKIVGMFDSWQDCQERFTELNSGFKRYNLQEALNIAGVDYDENIHDALVDAKNTALLYAKMQDDVWVPATGFVSEEDESYMYTPLGDVFKDLLLQFQSR